ncbi:hypothetical protein PYW08_012165 [Mythimna loreyi]|uniref:Uncharacterized protein n=1 Tax=Mythimna loreyi TaxID=667449 RepID=A0ACC2PZH1_9NEOP|nr:hypothetical protein PYW08_012165 [Mythimna loreyi]
MSKMDRQLNSKKDQETIYEIYRACRLCGAGAGYKMPIIQNVVDVDETEVELKQKVRECVQIEVHQDDKMPPLICELCVDKVNDFYEFLEMCRQTNKRTRLRLGLPPQSMPKGAPDAGECILGLTEPVYVNEDSDGEPLSKQKKVTPKVKVKREPELKVKLENRVLTEVRTTRLTKRSPTPPRVTRHRTSSKEDNVSLSRLKDKPKPSPKPAPKSILKKESKNEDNSLLTPRLKRSRDKEPVKLETPNKRVKIAPKPSAAPPKPSPGSSPRSRPPRALPEGVPRAPPTHTVGFTNPKAACNPCGLWFPTPEEAAAHHKYHRNKSKPYECRRCYGVFKYLSGYDEHFDNQCIPIREVPDVKCDVCWHLFATSKLFEDHKCLGEDHRPGGKCSKCRKSYALLKNLKKHEQSCTAKKKGELVVDPVLLSKVKPIQIRVSRCDSLLTNLKQEHYDVSNVTADFGLDKNCVYPYISSYSRLRIKSDPDGMVDINADIKDEFYAEEDYVHWDSEDSESDDEGSCSSPSLVLNPYSKKKKLESLANLSLKTIFSKRCLGKVPKKRRRVKHEKMFDSLLAGSEDDVTRDINKIIDDMGDDDDQFDDESQKGGDDSQRSEVNDSDKSMDVSHDKVIDDAVVSDKDIEEGKIVDSNDSLEDSEQNNMQTDYVLSEKNDDDSRKNFNSMNNDSNGSNNNISSNNENKINNGINSLSFDYFDGDIVSKNDRKNDESKIDEVSQDSNSIGGISESLLNDNTQSDVSENEKVDKISNDIDNATSLLEPNSDIDEKSQSNEFSVDNLSQDSKISVTNESQSNEGQVNENQSNESQSNENVTDTDYNNAISVIVNSGKGKSTESEDMDDSKLMEALDAQIGHSNENSRDQMNSKSQVNENYNEKIGLDDLIATKSSDIDSYQDFNFDA